MSGFMGARVACLVDDVGGDVSELAVRGLGLLTEMVECFVVAESVAGDEDALGFLDDGAAVHRDGQVAGQLERRPVGLGVGDDDRCLDGEPFG